MDKYSPKPQIEEHYHIRHLIEMQEKRSSDRISYQLKDKESAERNDDINKSNIFVLTDFFCADCLKDFKAQSVRQVENDWSCSTQSIAFYKTKCFCGKWCIRLITDKFKDAYWTKSKAVRADRGKHMMDILQPFETGYNLLYGKK